MLEVYSVRDLAFGDLRPPMSTADIAEAVREATGPEHWSGDSGSIKSEDTGYLLVAASPRMQEMVQTVLSDLRRLAAKPR